MNHSSPEDAQIQLLLSERHPPLADDGFSTRVMAALPAPAIRPNGFLRASVCAFAALAGSVFAWQRIIGFASWEESSHHLREMLGETASGMSDSRFLVAIFVTAASLVYAFKRELRNAVRM